jgi:hypothetical protein
VLVFIVPVVARRFRTLGALGEERIEGLHQVYNRHGRVLVSMRNKGKAYVVAMQRETVLQAAKARLGNVAAPVSRVFTNPAAHQAKIEANRAAKKAKR